MELNASLETSPGNNPERKPCQVSGQKCCFPLKRNTWNATILPTNTAAGRKRKKASIAEFRMYYRLFPVEISCPIFRIRDITRYDYTTHLADPRLSPLIKGKNASSSPRENSLLRAFAMSSSQFCRNYYDSSLQSSTHDPYSVLTRVSGAALTRWDHQQDGGTVPMI